MNHTLAVLLLVTQVTMSMTHMMSSADSVQVMLGAFHDSFNRNFSLLWSPYATGQTIIFSCCYLFFFFFFLFFLA